MRIMESFAFLQYVVGGVSQTGVIIPVNDLPLYLSITTSSQHVHGAKVKFALEYRRPPEL